MNKRQLPKYYETHFFKLRKVNKVPTMKQRYLKYYETHRGCIRDLKSINFFSLF